jgi:hypothetical protein
VMFSDPRSLLFNKNDRSAVHVPMTAVLKPANNFTFAAWYRALPTEIDTSGGEILSGGNSYLLRVRPTQLEMSKRIAGAKVAQCFSTAVSATTAAMTFLDGKWHHLAGVTTPAGIRLYYDGVKMCDLTGGNNNADVAYDQGPDLWTGRHGSGQTNWDFGGNIDDVRVYNRVLSDPEILSLAQGNP